MIPYLKNNVKFITMKLAETERSTIVDVMTIKAMIEPKV